MTQTGWAEALTRRIGKRVQQRRKGRMTAQDLAARCAQLGMPLHRSVIANLESGRRPVLSVAELLILARALDIAPVELIAPVGSAETMDFPPGLTAWDAAQWISGIAQISEAPSGALEVVPADDQSPIMQFYLHAQLVQDWEDIGPDAGISTSDGKVIATSADLRRDAARAIRRHRSHMRKRGLIPPPLPTDLAYMDDEPRGPDGQE